MEQSSSAESGHVEVVQIDRSLERSIALALSTSREFLQGIRSVWQGDLFAPWLRQLAEWCFAHVDKYEQPPNATALWEASEALARRGRTDKDDHALMQKFIRSLELDGASQTSKPNVAYLLDRATARIKELSMARLAQDLRGLTEAGEIEEAEKVLAEFRVPERPARRGINPLTQKVAWQSAFEQAQDSLFQLPGSVGHLIGPICRDDFGAFVGPEKRGKTFWLMLAMTRALESRCTVAYFQLGDLSEAQVYRRLGVYLTGRHYSQRHCGVVLVPIVDCSHNQTGQCPVPALRTGHGSITTLDVPARPTFDQHPRHVPCTACFKAGGENYRHWSGAVWWRPRGPVEPLQWQDAWHAARRYFQKVCQGEDRLRVSVHANKTLSVVGMERVLDVWQREDKFTPDVIVADYAALFAPISARLDFRHQQDETWSALRRVSQERHCAVLTADQADAQSYTAKDIRERHFTEDKRKAGHVNIGFITLNQTRDEKVAGIMRIGRLFVREDDFDVRTNAIALQCYQIGRPYVGGWISKG